MQPYPVSIAGNDCPSLTERHPLRTLATLAGGALAAVVVLVSGVATGGVSSRHPGLSIWHARSDTDSTAIDTTALEIDTTELVIDATGFEIDTTGIDMDSVLVNTSLADTLDTLYTPRADFYIPSFRRDPWTASPMQRRGRPFHPRLGNYWKHEVELDSTEHRFTIREYVGQIPVRYPLRLDYDVYRQNRLSADLEQGWIDLIQQRARQREQRSRGGLGFNIVVPGGQQSAFTTIFGKPEVDLRVNGQADIKAGFDYRKSDQQISFTGRASQVDPDFKQDLRLGITGTIGDKLRVDVNWDTNNQFDYQNQLRLQYQGYEDEIIQNIEAGNVNLTTQSRLIRGGQSLFGIKSQLQIGGLQLTTVASQQEGQSNSLNISGGSETTEFELKPTDYDDNTHYFLGYYFRNRWEDALSAPPNVIVANGFERITDIEVWKLDQSTLSPEELNARQVVAMVDLGEDRAIVGEADSYTRLVLPASDGDLYDDPVIESQLRDGNVNPREFLTSQGLADDDYQVGKFKKLIEYRDYVVDDVLGYISLTQRLQESEAIAVAFRYVAAGRVETIGDFSTETGGSTGGQNEKRLALKLLKPVNLRQPALDQNFNPAAWYLELRNIYRLPARGLNPNDFELQIEHQPPGKPASKVVTDLSPNRQTLLQQLGLDRLNVDGAIQPDDKFDYLTNYTIDPSTGKLIFPYLQPFGSRIRRLIASNTTAESEIQRKIDTYVFSGLYTQKKEKARRDFPQYDVYLLRGSYKGSVQEFYDLRAFAGLVEGSVRVTSGGSRLTEGSDFVVDYQGGTVTITNPAYLSAGRDIDITYEQNSFFNLQKKTLLGARADYNFGENLLLGGTIFNLNQKSPIDKFRIGEEPISNTIWGVDGVFDLQPHWLTRAIDALPFIQTKAPSSIHITGEFAQLRPGASQTVAFDRSRNKLMDLGRDFNSDELRGISYLDDFEGFENTYSLRQPGAWRLAAAPDGIRRYPSDQIGSEFDALRTHWRGAFGWYSLQRNVIADLGSPVTAATTPVEINDVFPEKDTRGQLEDFITTLDLYFDPRQRGPYNYTPNLKEFLQNPKDVWGGMVQRIPEGYTDFSLKNIEFIEFIVRPFAENGEASRDARLYVDIGSISEDVLPNGKLNTEDGITTTTASQSDLDEWGRLPRGTQNSTIDVDESLRRTEDLGLDGLASYDVDNYEPLMTEQFVFQDFLATLDESDPDPRYRVEVAKARRDPSGDDFFYFGADYFRDPTYFPGGASIQERFLHYFPGMEINSFEAQQKLAPSIHGKRGNSRTPDTEDLNLNSALDTENSYFQYELPLTLSVLDSLAAPDRDDDYVVTQITSKDGVQTGWYQVRIPISDYSKKVGAIQDFTLIESIRLWTTGHDDAITIRFAEFELVGSQWQKSKAVAGEREEPSDELLDGTRLSISSINNEENADIYSTPNGTIVALNRLAATGGTQRAREQAMVLRVENLKPGKQRAIFKTYTQSMDLLKYANLRMFAHMHGETAAGVPIESRDKVKLFLRLGANETGDFYEYEMPLSPSPISNNDPDAIWQTHQSFNGETVDLNSVNLLLGALNQLKVTRDERAFPTDSVFWSDLAQVSLSPSVEEFAPPGTRIGIRGTPSLGRINAMVIGIRNAADSTIGGVPNNNPDDVLQDVTVWVNEMRVAGYDETNGWAAIANADIKLADLGSIKASWQMQTDGFGGLESTLGQREQKSLDNWSVTTDVNLDKFIPERFGWTIPLSVQVQSNSTTPRFAPNRGDIRLEELLSQIEGNETLSDAERQIERQEAIESAQTATRTESFTTRIQKQGSDSRLLRNTIDGLSLNYSFSNSASRDPSQRMNDNWRWSTTLNYRLNIRKPYTVKPFWFLDAIPIIGALGDLQFNYVPQAITAGATAARTFSERQDRPRQLPNQLTDDLPDLVEFPLRQQHALSHRRNFSMQYNPFQFLNLSYDAATNQSMNALGVDTVFSVVIRDTDLRETIYSNMTREEAISQGIIPDSLFGISGFEVNELRVAPAGQVINRIFSGHEGLRSDQHDSRFTGSFRPNFTQSKLLDWITFQDIVYGSQFRWQNGAIGRPTGATVGNQLELRGGVTLKPQELFRKIPFYTSIEQAQTKYTQQKEAERRQREQDRLREKQAREELKQNREAAREKGEDLPEAEPVPEDTTRSRGGFRLPLPNPISLLRQTILALTGVRDLTITYNANQSATSSNVGSPVYDEVGNLVEVDSRYSLLDGFRGDAPSLGYRFGLQRHLPLEQRAIDSQFQVTDVLRDGNQIQGRTSLNPSPSLQVNLTWTANWDTGTNFSYRPNEGGGIDLTTTSTGSNRASVWAFNASYLDLFAKQLETFEGDFAATDSSVFGDANRDGRVVLTNESVVQDFQDTFLSGLGTIDSRGLLPFPMPNWTANYTGIAKWPLIRNLVVSASVRHGYSSDYTTDYRKNPLSADSLRSFDLGGQRIQFFVPREEVGGIRVNQRYQPLVGLDMTFKGRIQTSMAWNQSTAYSLSTTNFEVSENKTNELTMTASYQVQGMKLPFFKKKLNNRISFNLTMSHATLTDQRYSIRRGLVDRIARGDEFVLEDALKGDNISIVTASTRVTVVPRISYQFSNRVSADFTLRYENFLSEDSRQPSSTNIDGGFNIRVSISN